MNLSRVAPAVLAALLLGAPCLADSYSPVPNTSMSFGKSASAVGGVSGACFAATQTSLTPSPVLALSCSGDLGIHSLSCSGTPCGSGGGHTPTWFSLEANGGGSMIPLLTTPISDQSYGAFSGSGQGSVYGSVPVGIVLTQLSVDCMSYNGTDALAGNGPYNPLDSTGLGGATIHFGVFNATHDSNSPLVLGSVVIPDSPQLGPYIVHATSSVGSPYTLLAGDSVGVSVTGTSTTATQVVNRCIPAVGT